MAAMDVAQRYKSELLSAAQTIQQKLAQTVEHAQKLTKEWSNYLKEKHGEALLQPLVDELKTKAIDAVRDQSPLEVDDVSFVCETFLWLAACLAGLTVGNIIGYAGSFALGVVLDPLEAAILAYVALPAYFLLYHTKMDDVSDEQRRLNSAAFSVLLGVLVGFELSDVRLAFFAPPAFVIHAAIGFAAGALQATNRVQLIGAALGASMAFFIVWAFIVGGGVAFLLWALVLCVLAAVDLQTKIAQRRTSAVDPAKHHLQTIVGFIVVQTLLTLVLGSSR